MPLPVPDIDPAPEIPRVLPVRLVAATPSLGCTFTIGALLTGLAAVAWIFGRETTRQPNGWLIYVFCGGFGFFGLLVLWSFCRQFLASFVPPAIVEISGQPLVPGRGARIALLQRGPARLRSLRANLVCLEQHITLRRNRKPGSPSRQIEEKLVHTQNLVDAADIRVLGGDTWREVRDFTIPADAPHSLDSETHVILWRIELWGRAGALGSFMHPFPVEVGPEPPAGEATTPHPA